MINESDLEFLHEVWNRRPFYTYVFFGFNILIFLVMTLAGGTTDPAILLAFGAKANVLIDNGEYWRFVTPVFIHIGVLHLFFNSYALWSVGPQVERLYGGARFAIIYLVTGIGGVAGSYWYRPAGLSAGASGAIFGLFGALLVFGLKHRNNTPPSFARAVVTGVLPVIVINLFIGFTIPMIDNSAHIAGLLSGMALAAVIPFARPRTQTPAGFTMIQYVLLAFVLWSWIQIGRHYDGPRLSLQNAYRGSNPSGFIDAMNHSQDAFLTSMRALQSADKGDIEESVEALKTAIDEIKSAPSLTAKSDELTAELLKLVEAQYALLQEAGSTGTSTLMQERQAAQNARTYRELDGKFKDWVNAEGERFGIQLRKPQ